MTYRNPVIPGLHPDPSVCRVDHEFFLVTSWFTYFPGVPIFRSTNLVDWEQIGNVLDRPSQLDLSRTDEWSSLGVYAPTIRHHDGRFWVITTNVTSAAATSFLVTAEDPAGPWSDPIVVRVAGIDPDLAWDDDGACWVHFSGMGGIARCRIDPLTGRVFAGPDLTWSGTGLQFPEAPHLFEREGTWYLMVAEGGTEGGHGVSVARGPSPEGPWESAPSNPILSHRSTGRPVQNTGHADMVTAVDGSWWMVLLGVRPRGVSRGFHVLGRETFLTPVEWEDGWPVPGELQLDMDFRPPGPGQPVAVAGRDDFDTAELGPHWVGIRRSPRTVASMRARPGWLVLHGGAATLDSLEPVFVGRRQQHELCRVCALVDPGTSTETGLALVMDETSHYEVGIRHGRIIAKARVGPLDAVVGDAACPPGPMVLTIATEPHPHGPDAVALGYQDDDGLFQALARLDGRYLSTETTGGFLGRTVGMYAVGGDAAFDWFDYEEA